MDLAYIKSSFVTMFVAVDPLGLVTIFLALTMQMSARDQKTTAFRSVFIAFCILIAAALGGQPLLEMLGISMPAFRIAGGLLLFSIAAEMVFERREDRKVNTAETAMTRESIGRIAAFPLAIPLMAGPGAITATILLASETQGKWAELLLLLVIVAAVMLCCLIVFLLGTPLNKLLGTIGKVVFSRLLGILLAAMAVQIIADGVLAFTRMA